jgi:hypothetical protein
MPECFGVLSEVTGFARPMSRRPATNRRELLLPSLMPDRHQTVLLFDPGVPPAPLAAIHGNGTEAARCWTRQGIPYRAAKQAGATTELGSPELIAGNHLWARLVFQRVRPRSRSAARGGQSYSADEPQRTRPPIAQPNIAAPLLGRAEAPVPAPIPPPVETLFTQLARRRLRGRVPKATR